MGTSKPHGKTAVLHLGPGKVYGKSEEEKREREENERGEREEREREERERERERGEASIAEQLHVDVAPR
ncbi:hypothetical protein TNCV_834151 [Trichonephila clavipes]|nr:hypothetical protein TNCV_834151 [Trichonephila clavipes]